MTRRALEGGLDDVLFAITAVMSAFADAYRAEHLSPLAEMCHQMTRSEPFKEGWLEFADE